MRVSTSTNARIAGLTCGLVLGLLLWWQQAAIAQSISVVSAEPSEIAMQPGETTRITIWIETSAEVYGIEVHLTYETDSVVIVDGDQEMPGVQLVPGDFLSSDAIFQAANEADNEVGQALYAVTLLAPAEPVTGEGSLLAFDLQAVAGGEDTVSLSSVILASQNGVALPIDLQDMRITVNDGPKMATTTPAGPQVETPSSTVLQTQVPTATSMEVTPDGVASTIPTATTDGPTLAATAALGGNGLSSQPTSPPDGAEAAPTQPGMSPGSTAKSQPESSTQGSPAVQVTAGSATTQSEGTLVSPEAVAVIGQDDTTTEGSASGVADLDPEQSDQSATLAILFAAALLLLALAIFFFHRAYRQS